MPPKKHLTKEQAEQILLWKKELGSGTAAGLKYYEEVEGFSASDGVCRWVVRLAEQTLNRDKEQYGTDKITTNKKLDTFHWRDGIEMAKQVQKVHKSASTSQDHSAFHIDTDKPISIVALGDTQLGSFGTDYDLFCKVTEEIINTPDMYVILLGDLLQMAIKMRGVAEVQDNILRPDLQIAFLESWLDDVQHKVIASTWCNHAVMREENGVGYSTTARILGKRGIYHNGIGHLDIKVGEQLYKFAISHNFQGFSIHNPMHGMMRYIRHNSPDRDVVLQGDKHQPCFNQFFHNGEKKTTIMCGSIQTSSSYIKRFYSLKTNPQQPVIELRPDRKSVNVFMCYEDWVR